MGKNKVEKKSSKAMSPYASKAEKVSDSRMEPSTPWTQWSNMTDEELEADLTQVGKKLSVVRNIYLTQDGGDDCVTMDVDTIPKKMSAKKNAKVCYTPSAKAKGK